jgi:nickel-dependent lactate racemase
MKTVSVPWAMWYGDKFDMTFPDTWDVTVVNMKGGPDIGDEGIGAAFANPIGSPPLREIARGRRDAAILIDDLTRPTPTYRTLPYILEELAAAGIGDDKVKIVCAIASHRSMTRQDFIKKIGLELVDRLHVINHNAQDNLEFYGNSSQGIPIWVNREFARADVKIAAGMITPRGGFFGGGAKLLLPGACGWHTIYLNHSYCDPGLFREHIEEVGRMVGLEFIANPLLNIEGGIMAMVTGNPEKAFQHGVQIGKELYGTEIPEGMDIAIFNSWPKDTEGTQASMGLTPLRGTSRKLLIEGGTIVIATASPEGLGYHSVMGPGTMFRTRGRSGTGGRTRNIRGSMGIIYSPNLNQYDVRAQLGDRAQFCKTWDQLIETLKGKHGSSAKVCVFPCGAIQHASA